MLDDLVNGFEFEKSLCGVVTKEEMEEEDMQKVRSESTRVAPEAVAVIRETIKSNLMEAFCNNLDSISANKKRTTASVTRMTAPKRTAGARGLKAGGWP